MQICRFVRYCIHCRSIRDFYLIVFFCTILMCYLSFRTSSQWKSANPQGGWQRKALQRSILAQHGQNDVRWYPISKQPDIDDFKNQLQEYLLLIENSWKGSEISRKRIAEIRGQQEVISRDLKLYENVLKKNGFQVVFQDSLFENMPENSSTLHFGRKNSLHWPKETTSSNDWLLLLCLTFSDTPCIANEQISALMEYQKVNIFPGLKGLLSKRGAFCSTMTMAKQLPELRNEYISPLCFVLPKQFSQLVHVAQALGYSVKWTVKSASSSKSMRNGIDTGPKVLDLFDGGGRDELMKLSNQKVIVQQLQDNPFTVFDHPISIRVYVLITSIAPLRAYVHNEGLVFHRQGVKYNFRKIPGRTWLLSELWRYIAKNHGGSSSVKRAVTNLNHVLLQMLLIVEAAILSSLAKNDYDLCRHCFQLLGVDCIFNKTLHPVILEVNGQPTLKKGAKATKMNHMKKSILDDMIDLLFPPLNSVASEVAEALHGVTSEIGILDWSCPISSEFCLSRQDLHYLLKFRQETLNQGGFRQLYPSADAGRYGVIIEQLQRQFTEEQATRLWLQYRRHSTSDLHRLLVNLERWYSGAFSEEYYSDIDINSGPITQWKSVNISEILNRKYYGNYISYDDTYLNDEDGENSMSCNNDPTTMPFLSSIRTLPALSLHPSFDPRVTEYYVNVSFEVMLVKVWATVLNCQTEARLDDRFGPSRPTNMTLGVGENRIIFMVIDISHTEPWIVNSYSLVILRLPVTHGEKDFNPTMDHQVCSLKQECEMKLFFNEPCGVQLDRSRHVTWSHYIKENERKPLCQTGDAAGRWILPCRKCSNRKTCYWKKAAWHPYSCKYRNVTTNALRKCLKNKKLLFIGDSTNRGMMHYLIERLNSTLTEWDKTHDIRFYHNVNNQSTMVSFAYYPQFWLPTNQRPVFDKALYQLIQRSRPLENNSNTILIIGGVHWLATQHLHMLHRAIRVERLNGIKLVMKTLGAGFHQPVDSVHSLSIGDQHKLILHNKGLSEFAHHYNFEVIDTFNITAARYKDFMQGKCACHFHRVVADTIYDPHRLLRTHNKYHVEGPINAIYSEILLSRLCSDVTDGS